MAGKTWTDDEVFTITQAVYMCGMAAIDAGFGRATVGPRFSELMPLVEEATQIRRSPPSRQRALRLADILNSHFAHQLRTTVRDIKRHGRSVAFQRWREREPNAWLRRQLAGLGKEGG
jgi:hypothetical protein